MKTNPLIHSITADGSSTLYSQKYGAHYHSIHGSVTEALHIFIDAGLQPAKGTPIHLLEIGLGTFLNAALTAQWADQNQTQVHYHGIELYPLSPKELEQLNYKTSLPSTAARCWEQICNAPWETEQTIHPYFSITKQAADFTEWIPQKIYNLVYFDAFGPDDQPHMWTREMFMKIANALSAGGVLVTYSIKGTVKRDLMSIGFSIERLDGPPGKKHFLRATKIS